MSHDLQTSFAWVMTPQGVGSTATAQQVASSTTGPEAQPSAQSHLRDGFSPSAPLPRARGEEVLPVWRKPANDHARSVSLYTDTTCVFLLQASCCPLVLLVPASCVCQVQGCPDAPLPNSRDSYDEPCSSTRYVPVHYLPRFLESRFCESRTILLLDTHKSLHLGSNLISNSDPHPLSLHLEEFSRSFFFNASPAPCSRPM